MLYIRQEMWHNNRLTVDVVPVPLIKLAMLVIYLFQDDDEAGCRWQTVSHHHICRQESQTQGLIKQEYRAKQKIVQSRVTARSRLGL